MKRQVPCSGMKVSFVLWLCITGPLRGFDLRKPMLKPAFGAITARASSPTGLTASAPSGGLKPNTFKMVLRWPSISLSGSPVAAPCSFLKRPTYFVSNSFRETHLTGSMDSSSLACLINGTRPEATADEFGELGRTLDRGHMASTAHRVVLRLRVTGA